MPFDEHEKELLEQISRKINNSSALNGGFDKLVLAIEHVKEKQEETSEKIDKVASSLYEPNNGLFARIQTVEFQSISTKNHLTNLDNRDEALEKKIETDLKEIIDKEDVSKLKATEARLRRVAGEDLEELQSVISFKKNMTKIYWSMIAIVILSIGKLLYELMKRN